MAKTHLYVKYETYGFIVVVHFSAVRFTNDLLKSPFPKSLIPFISALLYHFITPYCWALGLTCG